MHLDLLLLFHCCTGKGTKTKLHEEYPHRKKRIPPLVFFANRNTQKNMQLLDKTHTLFTAALTSLHCSIRSRVVVNFVDVCGFDARRGSRNCGRFVCRYDFHEDVLDSVYVPILLYYGTRIQ